MIKHLLKTGKRYGVGALTIIRGELENKPSEKYAVAFLISKQTGGAVERNRIKRWLREDWRNLEEERPLRGHFAVSFRGRVDQTTHRQINESLSRLYGEIITDA